MSDNARLQWTDPSGHLELTWDPADADQTAAAEAQFERLREAGYQFYRVVEEVVDELPVEAGRIAARDTAPAAAPATRRRGEPTTKPPGKGERVVGVAPMRGG